MEKADRKRPFSDSSSSSGSSRGMQATSKAEAKLNNVEDAQIEFESNPASSFAGMLVDADKDVEVFTK